MIWQLILDDVVEAPEQRVIQDFDMVGGGDDQAVGLIVLDHLQETVENPPDFTDIVVQSPLGADGIELVEEVNASNIVDGVEYLAQFGGCFSHVFCDEGVQSDGKEGDAQLSSQYRGSQCLACSGWTNQQQLAPWAEAMLANAFVVLLFFENAP